MSFASVPLSLHARSLGQAGTVIRREWNKQQAVASCCFHMFPQVLSKPKSLLVTVGSWGSWGSWFVRREYELSGAKERSCNASCFEFAEVHAQPAMPV